MTPSSPKPIVTLPPKVAPTPASDYLKWALLVAKHYSHATPVAHAVGVYPA